MSHPQVVNVRERPILFSAPMVLALLAGTKTQTRRPLRNQPTFEVGKVEIHENGYCQLWSKMLAEEDEPDLHIVAGSPAMCMGLPCPYGAVGDRLFVRESVWKDSRDSGIVIFDATPEIGKCRDNGRIVRATCVDGYVPTPAECKADLLANKFWSKKPSIHMPRWASRLTLEITGLRVERVQEIGKDGRRAHDVLAEGITPGQIEHWNKWLHPDDAPAHTYGVLWDQIHGKGAWALNPWCWCLSFKVITKSV